MNAPLPPHPEAMPEPNHLHCGRDGHLTVDGAHGVVYNADTVDQIDGNLASIRPDSPDIDRLLDARRMVGALRTFVSADGNEDGR